MNDEELLKNCENYIDSVFNASAMIVSCGEIMSCYAFEQIRQQIHEDISSELNIDYDVLGEVLGNLEKYIDFPDLRSKSEDEILRLKGEKYKHFGKKLMDKIKTLM